MSLQIVRSNHPQALDVDLQYSSPWKLTPVASWAVAVSCGLAVDCGLAASRGIVVSRG